jgi:hypothetical protein
MIAGPDRTAGQGTIVVPDTVVVASKVDLEGTAEAQDRIAVPDSFEAPHRVGPGSMDFLGLAPAKEPFLVMTADLELSVRQRLGWSREHCSLGL